eukprot:gene46393-62839_t
MKLLMTIAALFILVVAPAAAQMGGKRNQGSGGPKVEEAPKVDEKAYKAALDRIPEPKDKYDPWGGVAPAAADGRSVPAGRSRRHAD